MRNSHSPVCTQSPDMDYYRTGPTDKVHSVQASASLVSSQYTGFKVAFSSEPVTLLTCRLEASMLLASKYGKLQ